MAKNNTQLDLPEIQATPSTAEASNQNKKGSPTKKANAKKRKPIGKFFRDIWSELKKVEWASLKGNKSNSGVLRQTGTVLIVVLFFMVIIAAMDAGFTELLKLLLNAAA